ncbi:hypothetical protein M885DRAFT_588899 [Pelagophyceae sp. CCMP2097]|nr:hypothetical protein M885DRAFT_588899 [Pelagophyceae sp. CCMP2097]
MAAMLPVAAAEDDGAPRTVFGQLQLEERERRKRVASGEEPEPVQYDDDADPEPTTRAGKWLVGFEAWMATDWEFGPYYWQAADRSVRVSPRRKVGHYLWWATEKTLRGSEFVGEVVANILGMNDSKYQWVIDAMEEDARKERQAKVEAAQRRDLATRATPTPADEEDVVELRDVQPR